MMNPEDKKYILENRDKRSAKQLAQELGLLERKVQKFLDKQRSLDRMTKGREKNPVKAGVVLLSCLLIIVLGFAAYGNSLYGKFLWDDEYHVRYNAYIRSTEYLPRIFTQDLGAGAGRAFGFYRPVQLLTYILDYSLWQLNPFGYHLTNIILHILAALALYFFVRAIYAGAPNDFVPLVTSILYIVNPLNVGAVSYVSGRADPLAALFLLLSFTFYIKNLDAEGPINYFLVAVSYILALLSKEYALVFPFLLLLYHYSFKKRIKPMQFSIVCSTALIYVFFRSVVLWQVARVDSSVQAGAGLLQRLPGFFAALASYTRLIILPINLHAEYGNKLFYPLDPMVALGVMISIGLIYLAMKNKNDSTILFGVGWFFIALLPMSNIYPINAYMAEHWLYLPLVGVCLIIAKKADAFRRMGEFSKTAVTAIVALLIAAWAGLTINQNNYWKDAISFYERTLKYAPDSARAHNDLGRVYSMEGGDKVKAEEYFKKAIELDPKYPLAYNNLGFLYYGRGKKDEAAAFYNKAIILNPFYTDALNNLANVYAGKGNYREAIGLYIRAIETHPSSELLYSNLGAAYLAIGRNDNAEYAFNQAIKINPRFGEAYFNLAILYSKAGRIAESKEMYQKAVEFNPKLNSPEFSKRLEKSSGQNQ